MGGGLWNTQNPQSATGIDPIRRGRAGWNTQNPQAAMGVDPISRGGIPNTGFLGLGIRPQPMAGVNPILTGQPLGRSPMPPVWDTRPQPKPAGSVDPRIRNRNWNTRNPQAAAGIDPAKKKKKVAQNRRQPGY